MDYKANELELKKKYISENYLLFIILIISFSAFVYSSITSICFASSFSITISVESIGSSSITIPASEKICSPLTTIVGTAPPNKTVIIKGTSGGNLITVATTTSDTKGNFVVEVDPSKPLSEGLNTLTPYIEGVAGFSVAPIVKANPTTEEVPIIISHENKQRIKGNILTISGEALPGDFIDFYIKLIPLEYSIAFGRKITGLDFNIIHVVSDTVGVDGTFSITVSNDFPPGTPSIFVVVNGIASSMIELIFPNIYGIVYDSETNEPINEALIYLQRTSDDGITWNDVVPGKDIYIESANPQRTKTDGVYDYLTINGNFRLLVSKDGFSFPSTIIPMDEPQIGSHGELFKIDLDERAFTIDIPIDSEDIPESFYLSNNFPNPFNSTTTIQFNLPIETYVTLNIYNINGQNIKTLVNENLQPGRYSTIWDGTDNLGNKISSGIYIYRIKAGKFKKVMKLLFLK